jgi:hypothetical protein
MEGTTISPSIVGSVGADKAYADSSSLKRSEGRYHQISHINLLSDTLTNLLLQEFINYGSAFTWKETKTISALSCTIIRKPVRYFKLFLSVGTLNKIKKCLKKI